VVLSDVVPEMTAIAAARADERGLTNVSARVLDIEQIDEPNASYDVVLCREGLMFATDPARATAEIRRVLRARGRVAVAVWGARERNPWLGILFDAVSGQLGRPVPPPGIPGPFSLGDPDRLAGLLSAAGLEAVEVSELSAPLCARSFEEWWTRTTALAGPLAKIVASLPEHAIAALRARVHEAVRPFEADGGLELPGVSLIGVGHRR
jgi:SAM-dependent methyltransferase